MRLPILIACLSLSLLAQEKHPDPPDAHQADYWRTRAKVAEAQIVLEAAQKQAQAATDALVKDCGSVADPTITDTGGIVCVAKPQKQ